MNKKILVTVTLMLAITMLATPLVAAKPGAEKSNDKFEYFNLIVSGEGNGINDRSWTTPPDSEEIKTSHTRNGGWDDTTVDLVVLTVGEEIIDMTTAPYSVGYTTTFDLEILWLNDGALKSYNIRLTDIVPVYKDGVEIGTLVLKIKSVIDFTVAPPAYSGNVVGYGTEALKGVHVSAEDIGLIGTATYQRIGTITGWPEDIAN